MVVDFSGRHGGIDEWVILWISESRGYFDYGRALFTPEQKSNSRVQLL